MAGFDFLKAAKEDFSTLKDLLDKPDHTWFSDLINDGVDSRPPDKKKVKKKLEDDEIYELACYFNLIKHLDDVGTQTVVNKPGGKHPFRFAYAPGEKENFASFRFVTEFGVVDCLCDIAIPVDHEEPSEAPDISLELMDAQDDLMSKHGFLFALWEIKYHALGKKLTREEFNQMIGRLSMFGLDLPAPGDPFDVLQLESPYSTCGILTNGPKTQFNKKERFKYGFSIAFAFDLKEVDEVEPTRDEHIAKGSKRPS